MLSALSAAAFMMGLAGGPHCLAMCGAACAGVSRAGHRGAGSPWVLQAGRLTGYCIAGAIAATAVQGLAWFTTRSAGLRPVWTVFHVAVLAWGLTMLMLARQPMWVSDAGRAVWAATRPVLATRGGLFTAGVLWAFMPCGLLYSALLVASLSGGTREGVLSMALFAVGSGAWLVVAPRLLSRVQHGADRARQDWGTRICGLLLAVASAFALWVDLAHRIAQWCGAA